MHNISEILEAEEKYKKLLIAGLSEDFLFPAPTSNIPSPFSYTSSP